MHKMWIILMVSLLLIASIASAETLTELKAKMDKYADSYNGTIGYCLIFKGKPAETISRNGDEAFSTASTIKTAVMCEVMHQVEQGKIKWTDKLEVQPTEEDRQGGGFAYWFKEGTKIPISQWVHLMITVSDNTATMLLREHIGQKNVNDWLAANGFKVTKLLNGKKCDELGLRPLQQQYGLGMTTPNEMARLIELIYDNKAGSKASCDRMMRVLAHQYWDDDIDCQAPPMHSASKSGFIGNNWSDSAIVKSPKGDYVLAIYVRRNRGGASASSPPGSQAIRTLAQMVWQHYDPGKTWSPPEGWDKLLPG